MNGDLRFVPHGLFADKICATVDGPQHANGIKRNFQIPLLKSDFEEMPQVLVDLLLVREFQGGLPGHDLRLYLVFESLQPRCEMRRLH